MSQLKEQQVTLGDVHQTNKCGRNENIFKLPLEVRVLRNLQLETKTIQHEFFKSIYELEIEYQKKYDKIYEKRCDIVNGIYIPTKAEGHISQIDELKSAENKNDELPAKDEQPSGIPKFWLNVLSSTIFEIHEDDLPILEHLTDVRARNKPFAELGFVLEFHFSPNEFFENETLTKEYLYKCSLGNKMVFEGPQIYKSIGCEVKWKDGQTTPKDSFFNFFHSNQIKNEPDDTLESEQYAINTDFEMGYFIKERIIPRAVLFYGESHCTHFPYAHSRASNISISHSSDSIAPDQATCDEEKFATACSISSDTRITTNI